MASPRPPLPPVTRAVRCSAGIAATGLARCLLVLCRGPHGSPLFENILEREYRIALAYGLRNRFLPVLNSYLQALGEGCLVFDRDLCQRLRAAHVVLELTPEGLCGQRGQFLPILGLEQAFDFGAGLGNALACAARSFRW